eukprot:CAMPEP_0117668286 /NCGR_PEP_ID=MMETSP0804-20121206/11461_1 /TAXON_ID=1074897 /ORGANISM="Tetraselmis astigmatica, Strain CCMP880" /LENGTH=379 /DNA_ID=CAMNT_0005476153 /DNA_START=196 /DNA_END=1336 /DNA_ORIENTATION=+
MTSALQHSVGGRPQPFSSTPISTSARGASVPCGAAASAVGPAPLQETSGIDKSMSSHLEAFHRDGFVAIPNAVTPDQLALLRAAAEDEIEKILESDPNRAGNRNRDRGGLRYSIGSVQQFPRQEWALMLDYLLVSCGPLLDEIFKSSEYHVVGAGGDFSLPGAQMQPLHTDLFQIPGLPDPQAAKPGEVSINDVPTPFLCINLPLVDFTVRNGPVRQIPGGTHHSREEIPSIAEEPQWMKDSLVCVPAGTALVRDVRAWHGGTPNQLPCPPPADAIGREAMSERAGFARPMLNVEFTAPWFRMVSRERPMLPEEWWAELSPRAQALTKHIVYRGDPLTRVRDDRLNAMMGNVMIKTDGRITGDYYPLLAKSCPQPQAVP